MRDIFLSGQKISACNEPARILSTNDLSAILRQRLAKDTACGNFVEAVLLGIDNSSRICSSRATPVNKFRNPLPAGCNIVR
ncbi:hypothetical protein CDAR_192871 [Caerostris darwini]|uniref:Uncharacterized protein n=1 Tax=Caerostris darwini TaxID=1538125 RepID=A0AAV4S1Q7_9ARAC|nr:hypothetical protein CDAR_192871 [Caerostris darwini]